MSTDALRNPKALAPCLRLDGSTSWKALNSYTAGIEDRWQDNPNGRKRSLKYGLDLSSSRVSSPEPKELVASDFTLHSQPLLRMERATSDTSTLNSFSPTKLLPRTTPNMSEFSEKRKLVKRTTLQRLGPQLKFRKNRDFMFTNAGRSGQGDTGALERPEETGKTNSLARATVRISRPMTVSRTSRAISRILVKFRGTRRNVPTEFSGEEPRTPDMPMQTSISPTPPHREGVIRDSPEKLYFAPLARSSSLHSSHRANQASAMYFGHGAAVLPKHECERLIDDANRESVRNFFVTYPDRPSPARSSAMRTHRSVRPPRYMARRSAASIRRGRDHPFPLPPKDKIRAPIPF